MSEAKPSAPAAKAGAELPEIIVSDRHLPDISGDCWDVIEKANRGTPEIFQFGTELARIHDIGGSAEVAPFDSVDLSYSLERLARFIKITKDRPAPGRLPRDVNADVRGSWHKPVPALKGITNTPVVTEAGAIFTDAGYQPDTQLFYAPVGEAVPQVPDEPSEADVARAVSLLLEEWLVDFPFVDPASKAHVVAMALTAMLRDIIDGPTPPFALDAPTPGSGKGFLAQAVGIVVTGSEPAVMTPPKSGEEFRKRITALLMRGASMILLDNLKGELASAELAAALTARVWEDRILGVSQTARVPNRALWVVTGNNIQLDFDIVRRTVLVQIDPQVDRPWERTGFRHDPLLPWVSKNRHELVWALLVLIRRWVTAGRPPWTTGRMGSFEAWAETVGGILKAAGIEGFLANRNALYTSVDTESEEWRGFVAAWEDAHGTTSVTIKKLALLVTAGGHLPHLYAQRDLSEKQLLTILGKRIADRRDRRIGDRFIRYVRMEGKSKAKLYQLEMAPQEPGNVVPGPTAEVPPAAVPVVVGVAERPERPEPEFHPNQHSIKHGIGTSSRPGSRSGGSGGSENAVVIDSRGIEPPSPDVPGVPRTAGSAVWLEAACPRCESRLLELDGGELCLDCCWPMSPPPRLVRHREGRRMVRRN